MRTASHLTHVCAQFSRYQYCRRWINERILKGSVGNSGIFCRQTFEHLQASILVIVRSFRRCALPDSPDSVFSINSPMKIIIDNHYNYLYINFYYYYLLPPLKFFNNSSQILFCSEHCLLYFLLIQASSQRLTTLTIDLQIIPG